MSETEEKIQKIREYKKGIVIKNIDKKDEKYLEKSCFGKNKRLFNIYEKYGKYRIDNTSAAGVIQLTNTRLGFITKVPTHILFMLRSLKSEKAFLFDPDKIIEIEGGENFFDIIVRLFIQELKKIIRIGLLPKYTKKYENRDDLKGKLEIEGQIQNDIDGIFKFSCGYYDLNVNNLENQIVLKALNTLIPMVKYDKDLKKELNALGHVMRNQVRLIDIKPEDFDKINFDVSNEHYILIIKLSKLILRKTFIKSISEGKSIGFNFIVDMNMVFQDFITEIIKDIVISDFPEFIAKDQGTFRSFIRYGKERPDIGLKLKRIDSYPVIIELKYKKKVKHGDKVQVGAYSVSPGIPGTRIGCIICAKPEDKENEEKSYDYVRIKMIKNEILEEKPLLIYTIDLHINDNLRYEDFIIKIKERTRFIISDLKKEISL